MPGQGRQPSSAADTISTQPNYGTMAASCPKQPCHMSDLRQTKAEIGSTKTSDTSDTLYIDKKKHRSPEAFGTSRPLAPHGNHLSIHV